MGGGHLRTTIPEVLGVEGVVYACTFEMTCPLVRRARYRLYIVISAAGKLGESGWNETAKCFEIALR